MSKNEEVAKVYPIPPRVRSLLAYEAMDRASVLMHAVGSALEDHQWCDHDPVYKSHVERAIGNLYKAYQRAGRSAM